MKIFEENVENLTEKIALKCMEWRDRIPISIPFSCDKRFSLNFFEVIVSSTM